MSINFNNLVVSRVIMHTIVAKRPMEKTATVKYETSIMELSDTVKNTIIERLIDSVGRESKAFELELGQIDNGSFYDYCKDINSLDNVGFIKSSQDIAGLLAEKQKRAAISGGYLIVIDSYDNTTRKSISIIIKAELHEALQLKKSEVSQKNELELLKVFLSPSQKLFKIGILYQKPNISNSVAPNDVFGCILYDDQYRSDGTPAEYFYKDFLGFTVDKNHKILTKQFFDRTTSFIKENVNDTKQKNDLLIVLRTHCTVNTSSIITPAEFGRATFIPTLFDRYISDVTANFPASFVKDNGLIVNTLSKVKYDFPDKIKLTGPTSNFEDKVNIINSMAELENLDPNDSNYTIIKIVGKPFN